MHLSSVHKTTLLACIALAALTSCSHGKPISRDELKSKLRSAASIAAETGTFVDYIRQERATDHYAEGHIEYLSSELNRTAKELHDALPPVGAEGQFTDSRTQVDALAAELNNLRTHIRQPDQLNRDGSHIAAIGKQLQKAISSL